MRTLDYTDLNISYYISSTAVSIEKNRYNQGKKYQQLMDITKIKRTPPPWFHSTKHHPACYCDYVYHAFLFNANIVQLWLVS